jgi:hypothetical protein
MIATAGHGLIESYYLNLDAIGQQHIKCIVKSVQARAAKTE